MDAGFHRACRRAALALAIAAVFSGCAGTRPARSGPGYEYYVTGNPADAVRKTRGL